MNQMMIATLNRMPEEPCEFMKDYISLHYLDMTTSDIGPEDADKSKDRSRIGSKDLDSLRNEVEELKDQHEKFKSIKNTFKSFSKRFYELSETKLVPNLESARESKKQESARKMGMNSPIVGPKTDTGP